MMLRTIVRSDEVAYPWLAPAGVRRGVIDNAERIGYINAATGDVREIAVGVAPNDLAVSSDGFIYITETQQQRVARVSRSIASCCSLASCTSSRLTG